MRTAFVTGATGFVGLNLVAELCARGWRVTALHRPTSELRHLAAFPVARAIGDITDPASLEAAMPEGVEAVFHVAARCFADSDKAERELDYVRAPLSRMFEDSYRWLVETGALERGARPS